MGAATAIVKVTFKDLAGDLTVRSYELVPTAFGGAVTLTELEAAAQALVADIQAISDAGVLAFGIDLVFAPTAPTSPQSGSEIEDTAAISLPLIVVSPNALSPFGMLNIPAPKIGIFTGTSGYNRNVVDLGDADLLSVVAHFQAEGDCSMSDGQLVQSSLSEGRGFRVHRRSKRSRGRRVG
jgi:hypothetical protein